jgi:hypothetical protein
VKLCKRHTGLAGRNELVSIDKGAHRVLVEIRRGPRVLSGLVPVTEVVDKQLNAVAVGILIVESNGWAVIYRQASSFFRPTFGKTSCC